VTFTVVWLDSAASELAEVFDDALTALAPVFTQNWFFVLRKR